MPQPYDAFATSDTMLVVLSGDVATAAIGEGGRYAIGIAQTLAS